MSTKYEFSVKKRTKVRPFVQKIFIKTFLIFAFIIGALFLPWEQTVQGEGRVIAFDPNERNYELLATQDGFVKAYFVKENQWVRKGEPLCEIEDQDAQYGERLEQKEKIYKLQLKESEERLESLQQERKELQNYYDTSLALYSSRIKKAKEELKKSKFELKTLQTNYDTRRLHLRRLENLHDTGIKSKRSLELAQNEYKQAKVAYDQGLVAVEIAKQNLEIIQQDKKRQESAGNAKLQKNRQAITQSKVSIETINSYLLDAQTYTRRYSTRVIKAQQDGMVMRIYQNEMGRLIKKGEKILHFVPNVSVRSLLLKVSDFDMPLIQEDLPVRIRFYGWPALQITGWPKITHGTFSGYVKAIEPISHENGLYYVHIFENPSEPWPSDELLRYGTQATAWIRLESVPIWYQIWRYINAMPPNMPKRQMK